MQKSNPIKLALITLTVGLKQFLFPLTTYAQITNKALEGKTGSDAEAAASGSLFFKIISGLLSFMMIIGAVLSLINLVQAGINWISSAGETSKIEDARSRLTNALIGLIILSASYAIWAAIREFLGIDLTIKRLFP